MSTDTGDRTAAIEALTATINAGLDKDEAAARACADNDGNLGWRDSPVRASLGDHTIRTTGSRPVARIREADSRGDKSVPRILSPDAVAAHIARHDPDRVLRDVKAIRDLIAAILAERHDWVAGDEFYSCSQAVDYAGLNHESRVPGSACSDPDRAGQPCDCGRDARVERLLRIMADVYEEQQR